MKSVVFVPGTMGTILSTPQGEEVWPPTFVEAVSGYGRKAKLLQDNLVVGDIIRTVSCFDVYKPIVATFADMGFKESGSGDRLHIFPYDWRRDLELLAVKLADKLEQAANNSDSVAIVAHSMGGLIARLVLESGVHAAKPWFGKIKAFMTLGTPHLGAPLALARILGLDGDMGISPRDFREIASDRRYPSGYQLLPAPTEAACWDIGAGSTLGVLDIYNATVAQRLDLDPVLLKRAEWVHATLKQGSVPPHVRYFYFAATGHTTATRVNVGATEKIVTRADGAGDGTVPLWSALPTSGQKQLVVGEHTKFFTETGFKAVFYRLFGKRFQTPPIALSAASATLSVQRLTIGRTETVELLIVPGEPTDRVEGKIVLERSTEGTQPFQQVGEGWNVSYKGPPVPLLKVLLPPIAQTGAYRIRFSGQPSADKPVMFAVTEN